jgi:hypothetical protein
MWSAFLITMQQWGTRTASRAERASPLPGLRPHYVTCARVRRLRQATAAAGSPSSYPAGPCSKRASATSTSAMTSGRRRGCRRPLTWCVLTPWLELGCSRAHCIVPPCQAIKRAREKVYGGGVAPLSTSARDLDSLGLSVGLYFRLLKSSGMLPEVRCCRALRTPMVPPCTLLLQRRCSSSPPSSPCRPS